MNLLSTADAVGYKKQDTLQYSLPADPPWLLKQPHINLSLHSSYKEDTQLELDLIQKILKDYSHLTAICKTVMLCWM